MESFYDVRRVFAKYEIWKNKKNFQITDAEVIPAEYLHELSYPGNTKTIVLKKSLTSASQLPGLVDILKKKYTGQKILIIAPDGSAQGPVEGDSCILMVNEVMVWILEHHNDEREVEPSAALQFANIIRSFDDKTSDVVTNGSLRLTVADNLSKQDLANQYNKSLIVIINDKRIDPDGLMAQTKRHIQQIQNNTDNIRDSKWFVNIIQNFVITDKHGSRGYHPALTKLLDPDPITKKIFDGSFAQIIELISEVDKTGGIFPPADFVQLDRIFHEIIFLYCRKLSKIIETGNAAEVKTGFDNFLSLMIYRINVPKELSIDSLYLQSNIIEDYFPKFVFDIIDIIKLKPYSQKPMAKLQQFFPQQDIVVFESQDQWSQYVNQGISVTIINGPQSGVNYRESLKAGVMVHLTSWGSYVAIAATKTKPKNKKNETDEEIKIQIKLNKILQSLIVSMINKISNWHYNLLENTLDSPKFNNGIVANGSIGGNHDNKEYFPYGSMALLDAVVNIVIKLIGPWFEQIQANTTREDITFEQKMANLRRIKPVTLSNQIWDLCCLQDSQRNTPLLPGTFEDLHAKKLADLASKK